MRLLSITFIILLTLLTVFIANDSNSHNATRAGTSHGSPPMTWESDLMGAGGMAIYYWESESDYGSDSGTDINTSHYFTSASANASRTVFLPPNSSDTDVYRIESASAYASASASNVEDILADGEYCLYTKIVFHDNTGLFQGIHTRKIGKESTISKGYEYYQIVNNQTSGTEYTGAQSFFDSASHTEYVDGDNRLGAIAKSWIENYIPWSPMDTARHDAYSKASI